MEFKLYVNANDLVRKSYAKWIGKNPSKVSDEVIIEWFKTSIVDAVDELLVEAFGPSSTTPSGDDAVFVSDESEWKVCQICQTLKPNVEAIECFDGEELNLCPICAEKQVLSEK